MFYGHVEFSIRWNNQSGILIKALVGLKWYTKSRHQPIFVDITIIKEQHRNHNNNYIHNKLFMEVLYEIH